MSDPNQFVADEDDDLNFSSVRTLSLGLAKVYLELIIQIFINIRDNIQDLIKNEEGVKILVATAFKCFEKAFKMKSENHPGWYLKIS